MGKFHDTLDNFGNALELPDEFRSAISAAYDEDFSSAEAKVTGLESSLTEKDSLLESQRNDYESKLNAAKAANFDLLRAVPTNAKDDLAAGGVSEDDDDITISDLFGTD